MTETSTTNNTTDLTAYCEPGHARGSKPQIVPVAGNGDRDVPLFVVYHGGHYLDADGKVVRHPVQIATYSGAHDAVQLHEASLNTSTSQRAGVVAHALRALADHIERHHLPEPGSIEIEADHVEFAIQGADVAVWAKSLDGGVDRFDDIVENNGHTFGRAEGRLPDSGVRVAFEWVWTLTPNPAVALLRRSA